MYVWKVVSCTNENTVCFRTIRAKPVRKLKGKTQTIVQLNYPARNSRRRDRKRRPNSGNAPGRPCPISGW